MRWHGEPLLHFLAGGAMLFVASRWVATPRERSTPPPTVVIAADQVAQLRADYEREAGRSPSAVEEVALLERAVEEELLYREARARALDRGDRSITHRLIQKMEALADEATTDPGALYRDALALGLDREDLVVRRILVHKIRLLASRAGGETPPEEVLRAYYDHHREEYISPRRVTLSHVFLSAQERGNRLARDAAALRDRLRAGTAPPEQAAGLGDPFPLAPVFRSSTARDIERVLGGAFARQVFELAPRRWEGPLVSPYGLHLVWVDASEASGPVAFEAVNRQVLERWRDERAHERLAGFVRALRQRYVVRVESPFWPERGDG